MDQLNLLFYFLHCSPFVRIQLVDCKQILKEKICILTENILINKVIYMYKFFLFFIWYPQL